jgi:ribosomal protein S18 acetylase RimI-like enzyme
MTTIEPAQPADIVAVRRLAQLVFAEYGDYANILPRFFCTQGVTTFVARVGKEVVGFIMLGYMPWSGKDHDGEGWMVDLLALAVEPARQRQGIGSALMEELARLTQQMAEWRDIKELQLTCAETNEAGLKFFAKHGFAVFDTSHGCYSGGQLAWRLKRKP